MDILALLQCVHPILTRTTLRQFSHIIGGLLAMSGRVTMLGLARWAGTGGSYRTVQRWFHTVIPWAQVFWQFFRQQLLRADDVYILAGDEVVVTKAGTETFGLDRFFSGVLQKPVAGISFFTVSLVSTSERRAFPISVEQVVRTDADKAARQAKAAALVTPPPPAKRKPGRPKGRANRNKADVTFTPEWQHIHSMVQGLVKRMSGWVSVSYLALDGHFGNNNALQMTRQCGLHLISKLRADSALYFPYVGIQPKSGARRKYGDKVDYRNLRAHALKQTTVADGVETHVYQATLLHTAFSQALNVVIIVKTNLTTQAHAHVILFSSDLTLASDKLIEYYRLRFQIEFNFRDAKQYWGLEDFMTVTETAVTNAANLSLFMVNVAYCLRRAHNPDEAKFSVLDLKAYWRGCKYVTDTIKMLAEKPDANLMADIFRHITTLGSIHPTAPLSAAP